MHGDKGRTTRLLSRHQTNYLWSSPRILAPKQDPAEPLPFEAPRWKELAQGHFIALLWAGPHPAGLESEYWVSPRSGPHLPFSDWEWGC